MPKEKKYLKLEAGERKAVRQSGAMRTARKTGTVTNIYSGKSGGLWKKGIGSERTSPNPDAVKRSSTTPQVETKRTSSMSGEIGEFQRGQYRKQGEINQAEFEKTRLGSRMVKKAEKAIARKEKKGEDVSMLRGNLSGGVRADAQGRDFRYEFKKSYKKPSDEAKRKMLSQMSAEEKKQKKTEKTKSRLESKLKKAEIVGERKNTRLAKRTAKRNS